MRRSGKLKVGYFAQHQAEELVLGETPVQHMARALPRATPPMVRAQLARFGLDADRADTPCGNLSGGEKGAPAAGAGHARRAPIADPR
ncbi:MAG: hypothetical protein WDN04_02145 [Rhodospirillales bacterium]